MFHLRHVDFSITENYPMQMRRHHGLYEFYMFLYCHSPLKVFTKKGENYAKPGSFILYSPQEPQYWDVAPPRFLHSFVTFTVDDPDYFKNLEIPCDVPVFSDMNKQITDTIKHIRKEAHDFNIGKAYKIDWLLNGLFVDISRNIHNTIAEKSSYENSVLERFEQARFAIFEDPSFKIEHYANAVGFSTRRFQQYYKKFFSVVPSEDLSRARLCRAKELLSQGKTTSYVSEKIGFESEEYFVKWFRKQTQLSPKQFLLSQN